MPAGGEMHAPRNGFVRLVLFGLLFCATTAELNAQGYPTRAIRIVVAFAPGGGADNNNPVFGTFSFELSQIVTTTSPPLSERIHHLQHSLYPQAVVHVFATEGAAFRQQ